MLTAPRRTGTAIGAVALSAVSLLAAQGVTAAAAQAATATTFVSDLPRVATTNGLGPVEKDRSNGGAAGGDGRVLRPGGRSFAKGLGVHAGSSLTYRVRAGCTRFTATVGVDDAVGAGGSVVFRVYDGTRKSFDSGKRTGTSPNLTVSVPVTAGGLLRLVVADAGDGTTRDHADWADARLTCATRPASGVSNPFLGTKGYLDPHHPARAAADQRRSTDRAGAAALDKIASGPRATWFGDWIPTTSMAATVSRTVTTQTAAGALPVLVAYAVPSRDCGHHSAGGHSGPAAYRAWIEQLARGIGSRPAAVVLEPDALTVTACLSDAGRAERYAMLSSAVDVLEALPATAVYLDAGNAGAQSTDVMAGRLKAAGVARTRGFALNVSGYHDDATTVRYGDDLSSRLGGKHYIADTSRNGRGVGDHWCNPAGRGLGKRFTTATGSPWADAFTWIKTPGESDGPCRGGPAAGQWWTDYAIGLAQRANW